MTTMINKMDGMIDVNAPKVVSIILGAEGQIWVNVDGVCRFRCYRAKEIIVEDNRKI